MKNKKTQPSEEHTSKNTLSFLNQFNSNNSTQTYFNSSAKNIIQKKQIQKKIIFCSIRSNPLSSKSKLNIVTELE